MRTGKAQLIVRNLEPEIVSALRARAARSGRSMEAEHREILRLALRPVRVQGTLKERLLRMPDVGSDRDFARVGRRARAIRIAAEDPGLTAADAAVRALFPQPSRLLRGTAPRSDARPKRKRQSRRG